MAPFQQWGWAVGAAELHKGFILGEIVHRPLGGPPSKQHNQPC